MFGLSRRIRPRRIRSNSKGTPRQLRHETLESRRLLAGDVTVAVNASGDIMVTGDGQDNIITITESLTGISIAGTATNIVFNGETASIQEIPTSGTGNVDRDLILQMGGGDDNVEVNLVHVGRTLKASLNSGSDELSLSDSTVTNHLRLNGGSDEDFVEISASNVSGSVTFNGNSGNDELQASGLDVYSNFTFNGGDGDDNLATTALDMHGNTATAIGSYGEDSMVVDASNATIDCQGDDGADVITLTGSSLASVNIDGGSGPDSVTVDNADVVGNLDVHLRATDDLSTDTARVISSLITGNLALRGAAGTQIVSVEQLTMISGSLTIALGGGADVANVESSSVNGRTTINTGSGADNVSLLDGAFNLQVDILLGGANDLFFTGASDLFDSFLNVEGGNGSTDQAMVSNDLLAGARFDSIELLDIFPGT